MEFYVLKSTETRRGPQQKPYYVEGFLYSATIPTCIGPKAVYVRPVWEHGFLFFCFRLQTSVKTGSLKCSNK
jgi:hypothetical protein